MMQIINKADHNGIPAYWLDKPGLCSGTLVLGVGFRQEPAALAGITHLIEHLVLRKGQPATVPHGGHVDTNTVQFYASGKPEAVAGFLNSVAEAISNLSSISERDLAQEKAVIQAENPYRFHQLSAGLLTYRFGPQGPGAGHFGTPGTTGLKADEAIDWAKRWFTSANAALTFTGPIPASLDVRLPPGEPVVRDQPVPVITTPTLIKSRKVGVALSLIVSRQYAKLLGAALTYELLNRLRHGRALIYSVEAITTILDSSSLQLELVMDPTEEKTAETLTCSVQTLHDIARAGFSEDAIEYAREACMAEIAWDETVPPDYLDLVAVDGLFQDTTPAREELLDLIRGMSSAVLTTVFKTGLDSLIVAVDRYVKLRKRDTRNLGLTIDKFELWQSHEAAPQQADMVSQDRMVWRNKSSKATLELTETHLVKHRASGKKAITLADVVLVGDRSCGGIALMDNKGRSAEIDVDAWKNSKELRRALLQAFPAEIIRSFPDA